MCARKKIISVKGVQFLKKEKKDVAADEKKRIIK